MMSFSIADVLPLDGKIYAMLTDDMNKSIPSSAVGEFVYVIEKIATRMDRKAKLEYFKRCFGSIYCPLR